MHRRPGLRFASLVLLALGVLVAGCNARTDSTPRAPLPGVTTNTQQAPAPTLTSAALPGGATYAVQVDGNATDFNASFSAYFPQQTIAHPGDLVRFTAEDNGQPHTATLGLLADAAAAAIAKAPAGRAGALPEVVALPRLAAEGGSDVIAAGGSPCFVGAGSVPKDVCSREQQQQPEFTGEQSYYNSGWLAAGDPFEVRLAESINPGTYAVICLVHRQEMLGRITVVPPSTTKPTAQAQAMKARMELDARVKALQPAADELARATSSAPLAGNLATAAPDGMVNAFGPSTITVPVGQAVTWTVRGAHTISFNAPDAARSLRTVILGAVRFNPRAGLPFGGPIAPEAPRVAAVGAPPVLYDGGAWAGTGFYSSGVIVSLSPGPTFQYRVTFTKAGTYPYVCLIHPGMTGTVQVDP